MIASIMKGIEREPAGTFTKVERLLKDCDDLARLELFESVPL